MIMASESERRICLLLKAAQWPPLYLAFEGEKERKRERKTHHHHHDDEKHDGDRMG